MDKPHECAHCKKWGFNKGKLGLPNVVIGKPKQVTDTAHFECPMHCGWVDMTVKQMQEHI